jgi:hypothetical protein
LPQRWTLHPHRPASVTGSGMRPCGERYPRGPAAGAVSHAASSKSTDRMRSSKQLRIAVTCGRASIETIDVGDPSKRSVAAVGNWRGGTQTAANCHISAAHASHNASGRRRRAPNFLVRMKFFPRSGKTNWNAEDRAMSPHARRGFRCLAMQRGGGRSGRRQLHVPQNQRRAAAERGLGRGD